MAANPFDYINAINFTKEDIAQDEIGEKGYNPFMTNRGLSYFKDTVFYANEMNYYRDLDKRLQFLFLLNSIAPKKRFSKWFKADTVGDLEVIQEYYGYSMIKAKQVLPIFTREQIDALKAQIYKGGTNYG